MLVSCCILIACPLILLQVVVLYRVIFVNADRVEVVGGVGHIQWMIVCAEVVHVISQVLFYSLLTVYHDASARIKSIAVLTFLSL